jgi:hypothetical protein
MLRIISSCTRLHDGLLDFFDADSDWHNKYVRRVAVTRSDVYSFQTGILHYLHSVITSRRVCVNGPTSSFRHNGRR